MAEDESKNETLKLGDYLNPDRVLILPGRQEKTDVLNALIDRLADISDIGSRDDLAWGIFHREGLMSTGIGNSIATPHFRLPNVDDTFMALAVCPDGVADYETADAQEIKLVFMIVAGKQQKTIHIRILSTISRLFFDGRLKAAFLAASDPHTCLEILTRAES